MSDTTSTPTTTCGEHFGTGVHAELLGDAIDRLLEQAAGTPTETAARTVADCWAAARNEIAYLVTATRILGHQVELLDTRTRLLQGHTNGAH
ncbi:MAG: hypothetical protein AB7H92_14110 [Microbacteriaceae bacterium]